MDVLGKYIRKVRPSPRAIWEKDWETINEGSYAGIVIPIVDEILQEYPELLFQ